MPSVLMATVGPADTIGVILSVSNKEVSLLLVGMVMHNLAIECNEGALQSSPMLYTDEKR